MKVAHIIATLDVGGAEKQLLTLCREQVRHGYEVLVVPLKGSNNLENEFRLGGVKVDNRLRGKRIWKQWTHLFNLVRNHQSFIFHSHSPKAQLLLSLIPLNLTNGIVISKHDAMPFIPSLPSWLSRLLWKFAQARANRVILISNAIRLEMELRRESILPKKTDVIYYGISEEEIREIQQSNRSKARDAWKISNPTFVIGTVGRLVKEKNHLFLIEVFHEFIKINPNSFLVICGYGPLEDELRQKIEELNIVENVAICSNLKNVKEVYKGFDLFVLPSVTEGFGLVLLEAMSANLPILGSRVGAIPEVLGQDCEFMFNPTNQGELIELLVKAQNSKIRDEYINQTSEKLSYFSSESMFKRIESIYSSL